MKKLILLAALGLPVPALAQENPNDGLSLMERGAQILLDGIVRGMDPALEDLQELAEEFGPTLRDFTAQMGPALRNIFQEVEDWSVYEPPVILENGDIIIRRKPKAEDTVPVPDENDVIEL